MTLQFFKFQINIAQAVVAAAVSAGAGAVPIPGVDVVVNFGLIRTTITTYYKQLGLHETSPEEAALLSEKYRAIIKR